MGLHGEVHKWFMTPEQLEEYVKKHPIRPTKKKRSSSIDFIDYQWRGKKAAEARYKK